MAFEYRHATSADLQAIFQIEEAVMPTPWSMKSFQEAFDSDYSLIMVVTENDVICGFSVLYITAPEAELPDIVIFYVTFSGCQLEETIIVTTHEVEAFCSHYLRQLEVLVEYILAFRYV